MIDERVDAVLDRLYAEDAAQRAAGLPSSQRTRNVDRETGRWLALLVRATNAREVLEIGSSNGVSTIWLAAAARQNGGQVTGTEILPERAAEANRNLAEAGLDAVARVVAGDARETVATLPGPFDLVFIDAEKDDYVDHFAAGDRPRADRRTHPGRQCDLARPLRRTRRCCGSRATSKR